MSWQDAGIRPPTERSFAAVWTAALAIAALWPLAQGGKPRWWLLGAAAAVAAAGWLRPSLLAAPNRAWFLLGMLLGRVVAPVAITAIFFLVVTPMGLAARLVRKDPLRLRWNGAARSYWIRRTPPGPPPETMSNQF